MPWLYKIGSDPFVNNGDIVYFFSPDRFALISCLSIYNPLLLFGGLLVPDLFTNVQADKIIVMNFTNLHIMKWIYFCTL